MSALELAAFRTKIFRVTDPEHVLAVTGRLAAMTTTQFIIVWILFFFTGMIVNRHDMDGKGGVVGSSVLMIVVTFFAALFMVGFTVLGSM